MLLASGDLGTEQMTNLFNYIVPEKYQEIGTQVQLWTVLRIKMRQLNKEFIIGDSYMQCSLFSCLVKAQWMLYL